MLAGILLSASVVESAHPHFFPRNLVQFRQIFAVACSSASSPRHPSPVSFLRLASASLSDRLLLARFFADFFGALVNSAFQKVSTPGGRLPQKYGEGRFYLAAFGSELYTAEKLSVRECNGRLQ
jgi:hypothetical protein